MRPGKVRIMTGVNYITHDPYIQGDSQLIGAGTGEGYQKKRNEEQHSEQCEGTSLQGFFPGTIRPRKKKR